MPGMRQYHDSPNRSTMQSTNMLGMRREDGPIAMSTIVKKSMRILVERIGLSMYSFSQNKLHHRPRFIGKTGWKIYLFSEHMRRIWRWY